VQQALRRARVPADALAVVVHEIDRDRRVLHWRDQAAMNPASLAKLLTTMAALEQLGPAFQWQTPVFATGPVVDGVLQGDLVIRGSGDPTLVLERVWLLLRRVRALGVQHIAGDILLDQSAFAVPPQDAAEFDGESLRPYNVRPSALLLNHRSSIWSFVPDAAAGVARVLVDTPLQGLTWDRSVPLADGPCGGWREGLKARFEPGQARFAGRYPSACGELNWPVADPEPASFDGRLLTGLWQELGGTLGGRVREAPLPEGARPLAESRSPSLPEVVRDINKFSNNVMAQQLFLTLALQQGPPGMAATPEAARAVLEAWLAGRTGALGEEVVVDNGSGLSRHWRLPAARLARLLQQAADGPHFGELMASLPITGLDGTLRRSRATAGRAHLKTGSLRDVAGLAGWVLSDSGRRYVFVAIVNHPDAHAARPALDALLQWTMRDAPRGRVQP
jgi:serine-type D-Ala-D-Ala carboxypeptidase/endopeptidase (penicillin-binding protein 4)